MTCEQAIGFMDNPWNMTNAEMAAFVQHAKNCETCKTELFRRRDEEKITVSSQNRALAEFIALEKGKQMLRDPEAMEVINKTNCERVKALYQSTPLFQAATVKERENCVKHIDSCEACQNWIKQQEKKDHVP